ncbi:MAG TPA: 1-deoxy-D-xylulose-5-phosphate synthase [Clostridiaceae bacterium]|jgi:1-deoxy-D-xylulose-5-phosphate synthase|nr:1-deoxy-D-xylulose-5-phosphate synthase [Clostridiaceae bacterium]
MSDILSKISCPSEISELSPQEMSQLASELRSSIIQNVSVNGGHLASNLGVVELTIAMLAVFSPPDDQIVFDVGHQCYTYKLLTGRFNQFCTLRQKDGMAGFPKREESEYDCFGTGHSSTSISAALGLLRAKKILNQKGRVIAVIGDGALSGGMVYEALNDTGHLGENLIVVINDNQMSIDQNVGAISKHLDRLRFSSGYLSVKNRAEIILKHTPLVGKLIARILIFFKDVVRLIIHRKRTVIFEGLGFRYYGPIDGHNLPLLMKKFKSLEQITEPVIVHVCTQKGKGYEFAEQKASRYHSVAPFDIEAGFDASAGDSFTETFGRTMISVAQEEPKLVAVCAGMMSSIGLEPFKNQYPDRFIDVGIAEEHAVTMAAGMAVNGLIPVVALYSTFLQRSYDQILHDVCLQNLHVIFAVDRAGIVGPDGPTHQGLYDISMLTAMPNMKLLAPRDYRELEFMLNYAVANMDGPVAIRYPRASECVLMGSEYLSVMKMQYILRGTDVAIFSVGAMADESVKAAKSLEEIGISCELVDVRILRPMDESELISICKSKKLVVTCEDAVKHCGFSSQLALLLDSKGIAVPVISVGTQDHPVPAAKRSELFESEQMNADSIRRLVIDNLLNMN